MQSSIYYKNVIFKRYYKNVIYCQKKIKKSGLFFLIFEILDLVLIDDELEPDEKSQKYASHPDIVSDESEYMIILEEIHHGEEISPVMCLLTHATDKRK